MKAPAHFFITGRPRSRTAWLACYLTWGDTFCFHDALRLCHSPADLRHVFAAAGPARHVGHADPANLFFQEALLHAFPAAKWVLIDRDPSEAQADAAVAFGPERAQMEIYERKIAQLRERVDLLEVPFSRVDFEADAIGRYVTDEHFACPPQRHTLFARCEIRIEPGLLKREIAAGVPPDLHTHVEP